ncbi:MAG: trigger factor [Tepidisphaeraceae bacterium]|jgi:trigger factor
MAETEPAVQEPQEIPYNITVEDAGPATKKVTIEIPEELIASKLAEQFQDLRREAAVPGFRPGHAPAKLIERRFQGDVKQQVCRTLISQAYEQAVQKNSLQVIGEPEFDKPEELKLPESGKLTYSFQVEVQPEITLPPLQALKIKRVKVEVLEKHIDKAILNLREQQGALIPIEDRGVEAGDHLFGDIHLKLDGKVIWHRHDLEIVAQPGAIFGIQIDNSDEKLKGLRPGEKREFTVQAPADHFDENVRGKEVVVEVALKELKRLELAEVNHEFLENLGFQAEKELRDALKEQMIERVRYDIQESMRQQVHNYLLSNVWLNLPTKLSQRQADRVVQRRTVELLMRGVPESKIPDQLEALKSGAQDEAAKELKLFFILQKIAAEQGVDVSEAELNGRIAVIAAQTGRRPEKVRQEMSGDGSLMNLYVQMREQKAIDKILETAQVEEIDPPPEA